MYIPVDDVQTLKEDKGQRSCRVTVFRMSVPRDRLIFPDEARHP